MKPTVRCSSLDTLFGCNGSFTLIPLVQRETGRSKQAVEGDNSHLACAHRLVTEFGAVAPNGLPKQSPFFKPSSYDEWSQDFFVEAFMAEVGDDMAIEVENELIYDYGPFVLSGHQDALAINPEATEAVGADYKRGRVPVDAASCNWQIFGYAVQLKRAYPTLKKLTYLIIQPSNNEDAGYERVSRLVIEGDQLNSIVPFMTSAIEGALINPNEIETGWKHCRYCPVALQCPAIHAELEEMKLTLTPEIIAKIKANPDLEQLSKFAMARKLYNALFDKAGAIFKEQLADGSNFVSEDGNVFSTKERNGPRTIEPEAGWGLICDMIDSDEAYACLKLSPSAVEKALAKQFDLPKTSKKGDSAKSEYERIFGSITSAKKITELVIG